VGAIELTALLWREREAVQAVLERQQELAQVLCAPDGGRVDRAVSALQDVLDRLRPVVLLRDIEVAAVAEEWGVSEGLTVAALPRFAPPGPWGGIFSGHLDALRQLAERVVEQGRVIDAGLPAAGVGPAARLPISPDVYTDPAAS
jgi:hypothetical protein